MEQAIAEPLGDDDIRRFLPSSTILKYSELANYGSLDKLLTHPKDYCIILYEDSPNQGHWTCLSRPDEKTVEFFDSYGGYPDSQQKWVAQSERVKLGEGKPYLTQLLDKSPYEVQFNPKKYQKDGSDINTCGRHCITRIGTMLEGLSLADYYKFLKKIKKDTKLDYDEIVTALEF